MNIFVVTVTYGNRFHLLKQVIDRALEAGVTKVIVVDNNSVDESKNKLREYEKELGKDKIKVLYLDDNYGSAGGFKRGLQEAYSDSECEYILTLDDDNLIPENTLEKIKALLQYLDADKENVMLSFYRDIMGWNRRAINEGWIKSHIRNNFIGFNFLSKVKSKLTPKKGIFNSEHPLQPALVAEFGGLFFNKTVISRIGYPREDFIVYADDHEFTYRFHKYGGKIFLCSRLPIVDLDITGNPDSKIPSFFDPEFSEFKMYYSIRNHVYFSNEFTIDNMLFYYGNAFIFLLAIARHIFQSPSFSFFIRRYKLILRAVKDGLSGRLGKTF